MSKRMISVLLFMMPILHWTGQELHQMDNSRYCSF
jgi:hypothetical protein